MSQAPADTIKSKPSASDENIASNIVLNHGPKEGASDAIESANATVQHPKLEGGVAADDTEVNRVISEDRENSNDANECAEDELDGSEGASAPPLPDEDIPPLPQEPPPIEDDGWAPVWEDTAQAFYFYNRFTGATQWTNPRVPEASQFVEAAPGLAQTAIATTAAHEGLTATSRPAGGYDPSIHGDYDPTAWYAQQPASDPTDSTLPSYNPADAYAAVGHFNRFTGRWQAAEVTPENHNDENKSRRQMNAYFDVDAAANSHDGRSLRAERSGKKLSKSELKQFKEKRKAKKEERRRAWLRD